MHDFGMAAVHHLLVFGLVAMMAMQRVLLRGPGVDVARLARLDMGVGATSGLVLAAGLARVFWGGKGWAFYEANPLFWGKIGCFALIGLLSIGPTRAFLNWARAHKADAGFQPTSQELTAVRRTTGLMALLLIPLLICAAGMARWPLV